MNFHVSRLIAGAVLFATSLVPLANAATESYPAKPLRFVVPYPAGSATDQAARYVAQHITEKTSQPVVVDNRAGANGIIGVQYAMNMPNDGYSVLVTSQTTHAANPSLYKKLPYDPLRDFMPVTTLLSGGLLLVVPPSSPFKSVRDLVEAARREPGKLTFGTGNSASRVGGEMLNQLAKVELRNVPYKGIPAAITDLIGGQIDMMFTDGPSVLSQVRSGRLRAIGTTTRVRIPQLKDVPTIAEQGVPGYELNGWIAVYVPKGTPPALADKLNELIVSIMQKPDAVQHFGESGWVPTTRTRKEFTEFNQAEIARWAHVVRAAGIEPE